MKRLVTVMLAGLLVLSLVPANVSAKSTHYLPTKTIGYSKNDQGKMVISSVYTCSYTKKGIMKKSVYKYYDSNGDLQSQSTTKNTIKKNRIVSSINTYKSSGGSQSSKTIYKYKKGKNTKSIFYRYDNTKKKYVKSGYAVYKYTSKKATSKYYYDGKLSQKIIDTLNKKGLATKSLSYGDDGKLRYTYTYKYNKKGYCTKSVTKGADGFKGSTTYKYKYDKHGAAKEEKMFIDGKLQYKYVYTNKKFVF